MTEEQEAEELMKQLMQPVEPGFVAAAYDRLFVGMARVQRTAEHRFCHPNAERRSTSGAARTLAA